MIIKINIYFCFIQIDRTSLFEKTKDDAAAFLEAEKVRLQGLVDQFTKVAVEYNDELVDLRGTLYGKLGNAVQLEGADEDSD